MLFWFAQTGFESKTWHGLTPVCTLIASQQKKTFMSIKVYLANIQSRSKNFTSKGPADIRFGTEEKCGRLKDQYWLKEGLEIQFYLANRFILCSKFQNQTLLLTDRK